MKQLLSIMVFLILFLACSGNQNKTVNKETPMETEGTLVQNFSSSGLGNIGFEFPAKYSKAPNFKLKDLKGKTVQLSDFKGKIIILNFWATWCGPCKAEMPSMQAFFEKNKSSDIVMLAMNIGETEDTVQSFIEENEYTFPIVLDTDQKIALDYAIEAIPTTYIIGKDGSFQARMVSSFEWDSDQFINSLKSVL